MALISFLIQGAFPRGFDHNIVGQDFMPEVPVNMSIVSDNSLIELSKMINNGARNETFLGSYVIIRYGTFTGCYSLSNHDQRNFGGAIFLQGCRFDLWNSKFSKCIAHCGGSIGVLDTYTFISESDFNCSTAFYDGGAFYSKVTPNTNAENNWINITHITFLNCSSYISGGAVCIIGCNFSALSDVNFVENTAGLRGGGIEIYQSYCYINRCGFFANTVVHRLKFKNLTLTKNSQGLENNGGGAISLRFPEKTLRYYYDNYGIDRSIFIFETCFKSNKVDELFNSKSNDISCEGRFDLFIPSHFMHSIQYDYQSTELHYILPYFEDYSVYRCSVSFKEPDVKVDFIETYGSAEKISLPKVKTILPYLSYGSKAQTTSYKTYFFDGQTSMSRARALTASPSSTPSPSRSMSATPSPSSSTSATPSPSSTPSPSRSTPTSNSSFPTRSFSETDPQSAQSSSYSRTHTYTRPSTLTATASATPTPIYVTQETFSLNPSYGYTYQPTVVAGKTTTVVDVITTTKTYIATDTMVNTETKTIEYTVSGSSVIPTLTRTITRTHTSVGEPTIAEVPTNVQTLTETLTAIESLTSHVDIKYPGENRTMYPQRTEPFPFTRPSSMEDRDPEFVLTITQTYTKTVGVCTGVFDVLSYRGPTMMENFSDFLVYTTLVREKKYVVSNHTATLTITDVFIRTWTTGFPPVIGYYASVVSKTRGETICELPNHTITDILTYTKPNSTQSYTRTETKTYTMSDTYTWVQTSLCTNSDSFLKCDIVLEWGTTQVLTETTTYEYAAHAPDPSVIEPENPIEGKPASFIGYILAAIALLVGISGLIYTHARDKRHIIVNDDEPFAEDYSGPGVVDNEADYNGVPLLNDDLI